MSKKVIKLNVSGYFSVLCGFKSDVFCIKIYSLWKHLDIRNKIFLSWFEFEINNQECLVYQKIILRKGDEGAIIID